jgi:helicase MOV-10
MSVSARDKMLYKDRLDLFKYAFEYEELEIEKSYQKYEINCIQIRQRPENCYSFDLKKDNCPERIKDCMVCLIESSKYNRIYNDEKDRIFGFVESFENDRLTFKKNTPIDCSKLYHVKFIPNRVSYRACYHTIETIKNLNLTDYFQNFQRILPKQTADSKSKIQITGWFNKNVATNDEQKMAVNNILNRTAFPFPFVVFGPPGTGKTSTLVEAVAQISVNRPTSKILITAQSNSACDEIACRLMKFVPRKKIFRYYSPSSLKNFNDLDKKIVSTSNLRGRKVNVPTYEEFYEFQIVIVTLVSSNYLYRARIRSRHFDYIFVDECASAVEIEALIPVVGKIIVSPIKDMAFQYSFSIRFRS